MKCVKPKPKTNFEKLCEEISSKNINLLDQGLMENHLRELRNRKMSFKKEKEKIKKDVEPIHFQPEEEGFIFKEENQFDEYIRRLREKKEEQDRILKKQRYKIIIDSNKNFTKKLLNEFNKKTHVKSPTNLGNSKNYGKFFSENFYSFKFTLNSINI